MRTPENRLAIADPTGKSINKSLGISDERRDEIVEKVQNIIKEVDGRHSEVIVAVWNEFEQPAECAIAMYALSHEESEVVVHQLFRLPQNVSTRVDAE